MDLPILLMAFWYSPSAPTPPLQVSRLRKHGPLDDGYLEASRCCWRYTVGVDNSTKPGLLLAILSYPPAPALRKHERGV